jgi:hypothetical protein
MTIYSTTAQSGIDVNAVFILDPVNFPEYPAPPFQPGELAWGTDGSEWVYSTASVTVAAGNAVIFNQFPGNWSVAPLVGYTVTQVGLSYAGSLTTVTATPPLGALIGVVGGSTGTMAVPAITGTQTGTYFWTQRAGNCPNLSFVSGGTGTAFTTPLHTSTTAGELNTVGAGTGTTCQVTGIVWSIATASAAGPNPAILNYPYISSSTA